MANAPPSNSKGQRRREALTLAAAQLFWQRGYGATSIADVASVADVPLGNVYYYFKTKAEMADAVAQLFVQQTEALIEEVEAEAGTPRQALRLAIQRLKSTQDDRVTYGCPIAAASHEFLQSAPDASKKAAQSFSLLAEFLARNLTAAGHRPSVSLARARALLCEWQGGIALAHSLGDKQILSEAMARMERMAMQG
ncbi:MAG: TetR/AcrR family transcriptional regulator [Pseudomonadota bacterium]